MRDDEQEEEEEDRDEGVGEQAWRMRTPLVLELSYDGSRFDGFQLQVDRPTVQGAVEAALTRLVEGEPRIVAAGRTDRGVHATGQVVSVRNRLLPPPEPAARMLDRRLAPAVRVAAWALGEPGFSPRHHAVRRAYRYTLRPGAAPSPFLDPYSWAVPRDLAWEDLERACRRLEGEHDFTSFATKPRTAVRLRRTLDRVTLVRDGPLVHLDFEARAFLRGQIRNLVGALLAVGLGRLSLQGLDALLAAEVKGNPPEPAPPGGLYLTGVTYPEDRFRQPFRRLSPEESA